MTTFRRGDVITVDKLDVIRRLGRLSTDDFALVMEGIGSIVGFQNSASASR